MAGAYEREGSKPILPKKQNKAA